MGKSIRVSKGNEVLEIEDADLKAAVADGYLPQEKITVGNSKTKETYEIDPKDLSAAFKDGFEYVKKKVSGIPSGTTSSPTPSPSSAAPKYEFGKGTLVGTPATPIQMPGQSIDQTPHEYDPINEALKGHRNDYAKALNEFNNSGITQKQVSESTGQKVRPHQMIVGGDRTYGENVKNKLTGSINKINDTYDAVADHLFPDVDKAEEYIKVKAEKNNGELPQNNETVNVAIKKVNDYKEKEKNILNNFSLVDAAVNDARAKNPALDKQIQQIKEGNPHTPDYNNLLPPAMLGRLVDNFIKDKDVQSVVRHNPDLQEEYNDLSKNVLTKYPEYGANLVANELSRARESEGKNNAVANFAFGHSDYMDKLAEKLYKNDPQKLAIYNDVIKNDLNSYIDTPGVLDRAVGAIKHGFEATKRSVDELAGTKNADLSAEDLKREGEDVSASPKGLHEYSSIAGDMLGTIAYMVAGSKALEGVGVAKNVADKGMVGLTFFSDEKAKARTKFSDPLRQNLAAGLNTLGYIVAGNAVPSGKLSKVMSGLRPEINEITEKLASGSISKEVAKNQATYAFEQALKFGKTVGKQEFKGTTEMIALTAFSTTLDKTLGLGDKAMQQAHPDGELADVAKTMLIGNLIPSAAIGLGGIRTRSFSKNALYEMAENPKRFQNVLHDQMLSDPEAHGSIEAKLQDLDHLVRTKAELDAHTDLSTEQKKQYILHDYNEKLLTQKAETITNEFLKNKIEDQIKKSQAIKENIFKGTGTDALPQEDHLTSKEYEEVGKIKNDQELFDYFVKKSTKGYASTLKAAAEAENPEAGMKEGLQYMQDKAIENPKKFREDFGDALTEKMLDRATTKEIGDSFYNLIKINSDDPSIPILEKLLDERESKGEVYKPSKTEEPANAEASETVQPAKESQISVIKPGEIKHPEAITIKPKDNAIPERSTETPAVGETSSDSGKMGARISGPEEPPGTQAPKESKSAGEEKLNGGSGGKPPISNKTVAEDYGDNGRELNKLANNIPDSGKVAEYMSKDTIEKYTGESPTNDQSRGVQELEIALNHGERIVDKAKELFGKDYAEKTLEYIENSNAGVSNKALMYVSLENALGREKLANPEKAADITKQQALVYEQSQRFARENSLALNYQKLRRVATVGYDIEKVTDNFFSAEELEGRQKIKKAVEADADQINKEAEKMETAGMAPEYEKAVQEGVEKEINKIYESLSKEKKSRADRAIKALEEVQKKLRNKAYDATLGIPIAIIDAGITTIKNAIRLGATVAEAVEAGIKKIKEKYGKDWAKEDEFRKDSIALFKEHLGESPKEQVKQALIEKGFGRTINVKGEKRDILDWRKLAGAAGTVSKISENVADVLKGKGMSQKQIDGITKDFIDEYVDLRTSVIEKAQNDLAKRNKEGVSPEQKTAAKRLSELYTYGLFESKHEDFENTLNKVLGARVSEKGFNEAKEIAKAMETIYSSSFKGVRLSDVSAKAALEKLEDKLRVLLFRESRKQGNTNFRLAGIVRNYFEIQQTMILNNLKQAVENPISGLEQNIMDKISTSGSSTSEMSTQRRRLMRNVYSDMVLHGGIGYGKTESQFVNRQHIDDYVNKLSDNELYHGIASVVTGKATLNAMDAMFKAGITEKKFSSNLIRILTHETNPKKMSKPDAIKFVSEKLTGQTFEDAQKTAKEIIEKVNKDSGQELISTNKEQVDRFANDIVKSALEMGGKITKEQIDAAYNAAYRAAGLGLGHEANNVLSSTLKGYSAKLEGDINRAVKDKEWNRAALLTYKSILFRNVLNPFVGGGTNWLVLKLEKTGLGVFTGLGYQLGSNSRIDLSTDVGLKRLEQRLYNQSRIKDNYMRGIVGGVTTWLTYAALVGLANANLEDYRKWRGRNQWASRYLDVVTPEPILTKMGIENDKVKAYISNSFNRNDAFDATNKLVKAGEYAAKGQTNEAWGAVGEAIGSKFNVPVPWRLVKDGRVIYQGVTGEDPYHGNYKPSRGFMNGVLQGGAIEWLGFRPKPLAKSPKKKKN